MPTYRQLRRRTLCPAKPFTLTDRVHVLVFEPWDEFVLYQQRPFLAIRGLRKPVRGCRWALATAHRYKPQAERALAGWPDEDRQLGRGIVDFRCSRVKLVHA